MSYVFSIFNLIAISPTFLFGQRHFVGRDYLGKNRLESITAFGNDFVGYIIQTNKPILWNSIRVILFKN